MRTARLAEGRPVAAVSAHLAAAPGIGARFRPMTARPVATYLHTPAGRLACQDHFIVCRHLGPS